MMLERTSKSVMLGMPGMSPDMPGMPNPTGFTIGMPGMPKRTSKNWE